MQWEKMYQEKLVSVEKAASLIESGDRAWFANSIAGSHWRPL
jgi:acyl-CoA hydrolase